MKQTKIGAWPAQLYSREGKPAPDSRLLAHGPVPGPLQTGGIRLPSLGASGPSGPCPGRSHCSPGADSLSSFEAYSH